MTIGSQAEIPLFSAIKSVKELADSVHADLGSVDPAVLKTRLKSISSMCDEVLKLQPAPLAPIPHASTDEKLIVGRMVTDLLAAGYKLRVYDGEEYATGWTADAATIYSALSSTDMDRLDATKDSRTAAWVMLVWGNGTDVISDYTMSLKEIMDPIHAYSDTLEVR
jgi:hypothetical protein